MRGERRRSVRCYSLCYELARSNTAELHFARPNPPRSFFDRFEVLLKSDNYVTRRFSLQLLSTVLLSRCNFNVMMRYISSTGAN